MAMLTLDHPQLGKAVVPLSRHALSHIPGDTGWPVIGSTLEALADPKRFFEQRSARYGHVLRVNLFGEVSVNLLGPEANELMLLDQEHNFSSQLGWDRFLGRVFPRGLILLDFDEHRLHRRALSVAFKAGPMRSYLAMLDKGIAARVAEWHRAAGTMKVYPAMKRLTLDLAATAFLGEPIGPDMEEVTNAFVDMVAAISSPVRVPLPGTQLRRGVVGRTRIAAYLSRQIPLRRECGGDDLFSQLCRAISDDGALLSEQAVVDHMSFLMFAAHDTLTSSLTAFVWFLAAHPEWQDRVRAEIEGLGLDLAEPLPMDRLEEMKLTEMAFKETLRLIPPVSALSRRNIRPFTFMGYDIPAGTLVGINLLFTHYMPEIWLEPERFDPMRFTEEAQALRPRFAFAPYGGGAHMCLGLNYAYMQAKCFARRLLLGVNLSLEPGYAPAWNMWPIPKPKDGLSVWLTSR